MEGQLPHHIVQLYLEAKETRLITRLKNIVKASLQEPAATTTSKALEIDATKYSEKKTPAERRREALSSKLQEEFVCSSSDSDEDKDSTSTPRKRKADFAAEVQKAHKKMCTKAVETMSKVDEMLNKVDKYLDKKSTQ